MTDEQRLERERGNIRDGYASLHSAQLGAQFLLAQLDDLAARHEVSEQAWIASCEILKAQLDAALQTIETLSDNDTVRGIAAGIEDIKAGRCTPLEEIREPITLREKLAAAEQREAQLREALADLIGAVVRKGCNDPQETGEEESVRLYGDVFAKIDRGREVIAKTALATKEQNG